MRIALADDSALFRSGLASLLASAGHEVLVQARSGDELMARLSTVPVEVAVLDIRMPPTFTDEGLRTAATLRTAFPELGILLLSTYAQADYAARLLEVPGAAVGYLLKDRVDDVARLVGSLERLVAGESVVDPGIVARLFARPGGADELNRLTGREQDILRLMAEGRSNAGISKELFVSVKTVETHIAGLFGKLGLQADTTVNRRVLAVLTWLRLASSAAG